MSYKKLVELLQAFRKKTMIFARSTWTANTDTELQRQRQTKDSGEEKLLFSDVLYDYHQTLVEFEDGLCSAGFEDFSKVGGDWYDNSVEIYGVGKDTRLPIEAQRFIASHGFSICFLNHEDGWETHYTFGHEKEFVPQRGWRRRWVEDPKAKTTNAIGEGVSETNAGYYEISYWPEGWGSPTNNDWLKTQYMRIVPDPLEIKV